MPKKPATFDFPTDLREAQLALHQANAEYEELAKTLPWSAEPMPGWESDKQLHSGYRSTKAESPGYTDAQRAEVSRLRALILELSATVSTHPYWESVEKEKVVEAQMALKHAHETEDGPAAA